MSQGSLPASRADEALTYAVGDVHGHIERLVALLERCERYAAGREMRVIFVGDYIDRGPNSRAVLERLIDLQTRAPQRILCLRGNHEAVAMAAARGTLETLDDVSVEVWLDNGGGRQTLESYGIADPAHLPSEHVEWMASLPLCHDDGHRLFAHAGVNPARSLSDQVEKDLLWIREPFLSSVADFGRLIVHGHTPVAACIPDWRHNRLNLDTSAGYGGPLTAAVFDGLRREPIAFLNDTGDAVFDGDLLGKAMSSAQGGRR